jgi:hypothetical protein
MSQSEIVDLVLGYWLTKARGWKQTQRHPRFNSVQLVVENKNSEVWVVEILEGSEASANTKMCAALGRLALLMDREPKVNAFGLAEREEHLDPALVRFALAIPDTGEWRKHAKAIPLEYRIAVQLTIALVSSSEVSVHLPSVKIEG